MANAPERRAAALAYVELRNFTRFSDMLPPERVFALANEFFSLAARAVTANAGKVLAVHNDALLCGFVVGEPREFCHSAAKAAQAVQADFGALGERWQKEYGFPAAVSCGLHTGEAVFGMAGPQGGEQFVAFGDCVSVAERVVHRARAGEIVLTLDFMKALGPLVKTLGAEELPPLELGPKRPPLALWGMVLETRLDFT